MNVGTSCASWSAERASRRARPALGGPGGGVPSGPLSVRARELPAIHDRHAQVEQDQIRPGAVAPLERVPAVGRNLALGAKLLEIEITLDAASHFVADRAARV